MPTQLLSTRVGQAGDAVTLVVGIRLDGPVNDVSHIVCFTSNATCSDTFTLSGMVGTMGTTVLLGPDPVDPVAYFLGSDPLEVESSSTSIVAMTCAPPTYRDCSSPVTLMSTPVSSPVTANLGGGSGLVTGSHLYLYFVPPWGDAPWPLLLQCPLPLVAEASPSSSCTLSEQRTMSNFAEYYMELFMSNHFSRDFFTFVHHPSRMLGTVYEAAAGSLLSDYASESRFFQEPHRAGAAMSVCFLDEVSSLCPTQDSAGAASYGFLPLPTPYAEMTVRSGIGSAYSLYLPKATYDEDTVYVTSVLAASRFALSHSLPTDPSFESDLFVHVLHVCDMQELAEFFTVLQNPVDTSMPFSVSLLSSPLPQLSKMEMATGGGNVNVVYELKSTLVLLPPRLSPDATSFPLGAFTSVPSSESTPGTNDGEYVFGVYSLSCVVNPDSCPACIPNDAPGGGEEPCAVCPPHAVVNVATSECVPCPLGYVANASVALGFELATECIPCPIGTYGEGNATTCTACPSLSTTARPGAVSAEECLSVPGYIPGPTGAFMVKCANPAACPGGNACAPGYVGDLCHLCDADYYKRGLSCSQCPSSPGVLLGVFVGVVVLLVASAVLLARWFNRKYGINASRRRFSEHLAVVSITVSFFQITSVLGKMDVGWPSALNAVFDALTLASFNVDLIAPECLAGGGSTSSVNVRTKWMLIVLSPLFALMVVGVVGLVSQVASRILPLRIPRLSLRSVIPNLVIVLDLLYVPVVAKSVEVFDCSSHPDGTYSLDMDSAIECYTGGWWGMFAVFAVSFSVFGLFLPLLLLSVLFSHKGALFDPSSRTSLFLGILYRKYRPVRFFYALPQLAKKLSIVVAVTFLTTMLHIQVPALFAIYAFSGLSIAVFAPYARHLFNRLELGLHAASVAILCAAVVFWRTGKDRSASLDTGLGALVIVVIVLSTLMAGGVVVYSLLAAETKPVVRPSGSLSTSASMSSVLSSGNDSESSTGSSLASSSTLSSSREGSSGVDHLLATAEEEAIIRRTPYARYTVAGVVLFLSLGSLVGWAFMVQVSNHTGSTDDSDYECSAECFTCPNSHVELVRECLDLDCREGTCLCPGTFNGGHLRCVSPRRGLTQKGLWGMFAFVIIVLVITLGYIGSAVWWARRDGGENDDEDEEDAYSSQSGTTRWTVEDGGVDFGGGEATAMSLEPTFVPLSSGGGSGSDGSSGSGGIEDSSGEESSGEESSGED